jgi:hypothetical protein
VRRRARPHPDLVVLLVSLLGVLALHAAARLAEPPLVPLPDVPRHEGSRVAVEGRVVAVHHGARGRLLALAADGHRLPVLAPPGDGPQRGDEARAVGLVTRLDAGMGLSLERLDVLRPAGARTLLPADLALEPQDHDGARVRVEGEPRDGWLVGGGARVMLAGQPPPARDGWWLASGTFAYDRDRAGYALWVDAWTRA